MVSCTSCGKGATVDLSLAALKNIHNLCLANEARRWNELGPCCATEADNARAGCELAFGDEWLYTYYDDDAEERVGR
jgi:hypothetical protein